MVKARDLSSNAAKGRDSYGTSSELGYLLVETSDRVHTGGFKAKHCTILALLALVDGAPPVFQFTVLYKFSMN